MIVSLSNVVHFSMPTYAIYIALCTNSAIYAYQMMQRF